MGTCTNCGNTFTEKYCGKCGQAQFDARQLHLKPFFKNAFKEFTHFDFKLFKDLPALVFRPGYLTQEYTEGRINKHIKPVTLFVWLNVFFFLFGYLNFLPENKFYAGDAYISGFREMALSQARELQMSSSDYINQFNHKLSGYQKSMFFFVIPVFALLLTGLYAAEKNSYYIKSLIYSIHFWAYLFIYFSVIPLLLNSLRLLVNFIFEAHWKLHYDGFVFLAVILVGIIPYTYLALKKLYEQPAWLTAICTIVVTALVMLTRHFAIAATYYITYWLMS